MQNSSTRRMGINVIAVVAAAIGLACSRAGGTAAPQSRDGRPLFVFHVPQQSRFAAAWPKAIDVASTEFPLLVAAEGRRAGVSPDGRRMVVVFPPTSGKRAQMLVIDGPRSSAWLATSGWVERSVAEEEVAESMRWSADGERLLFTFSMNDSGELTFADLTRRKATITETSGAAPFVSPSMNHFAYFAPNGCEQTKEKAGTGVCGARLMLDDGRLVWGTEEGARPARVAWLTDGRLSFCGLPSPRAKTGKNVELRFAADGTHALVDLGTACSEFP